MHLHVKRFKSESQSNETTSYDVPSNDSTLLALLQEIKTTQDTTLSFSSDCRSSVCGSCAMRVNGVEVLACAYKPKDGDVVEPLKNLPLVRDLVVDMDRALSFNTQAHAYSSENSENIKVSQNDEKRNEIQSDCILCGSCYSACPVYAVNENFIGPFALTRNWRYVTDAREQNIVDKINVIQTNGIWDCTLCNECVPVCPQAIAPKQDIVMLRTKSGVMGHMDPNMFGGGFDFGAPTF
ncbi:MAG: 2Fe-2S iron-sulfur cluster-binding protein [Campylobacterota bacterium]|nr:2Fe-2S iron-sulfur cluster-binding protein [Campylobacterota bacterium]